MSGNGTHRELVRRALFFLQKAYGYAQLLPPVLEQLKVLKVSSEADVSEDRLFELDARLCMKFPFTLSAGIWHEKSLFLGWSQYTYFSFFCIIFIRQCTSVGSGRTHACPTLTTLKFLMSIAFMFLI